NHACRVVFDPHIVIVERTYVVGLEDLLPRSCLDHVARAPSTIQSDPKYGILMKREIANVGLHATRRDDWNGPVPRHALKLADSIDDVSAPVIIVPDWRGERC